MIFTIIVVHRAETDDQEIRSENVFLVEGWLSYSAGVKYALKQRNRLIQEVDGVGPMTREEFLNVYRVHVFRREPLIGKHGNVVARRPK